MADDFSFNIEKSLGILSTQKSGWNLELNYISWGNRDPKYDIRSWDPKHEKMGKGITLKKEELIALRDLLNSLDLN